MKRIIASASIVIVAIIAFFVFENNNENHSDNSTLEDVDIKQLVNDYSVGNITNEKASITGKELIVTDSKGKETIYELPEDEFFVSIAPYVQNTHP